MQPARWYEVTNCDSMKEASEGWKSLGAGLGNTSIQESVWVLTLVLLLRQWVTSLEVISES